MSGVVKTIEKGKHQLAKLWVGPIGGQAGYATTTNPEKELDSLVIPGRRGGQVSRGGNANANTRWPVSPGILCSFLQTHLHQRDGCMARV